MAAFMTTIDQLLGKIGLWHLPILLFASLRGFPTAYHAMVPTFTAPEIDHWCARPHDLNVTVDQWRADYIPMEQAKDGTWTKSHCQRYDVLQNATGVAFADTNHSITCKRWEYDMNEHDSTLVDKWDLVCERFWWRAMSQSAFMAGLMIGNILFAHISDWFGRRLALITAVIVAFVSGISAAFSTTFVLYNAGRMFTSVGLGGLQNGAYTLVIECVDPKHRYLGALTIGAGWTTGLLTLPLLAYYIRDWFWLQILISITIVPLMLIWLATPESPRWLVTTRKYDAATSTLQSAITKNRINIMDLAKIMDELKDKVEQEEIRRKPSAIDLFSSPTLRKNTLLLYMHYIIITLLYYNVTYSSVRLGGNPYLSFALVAAMEYPVRITGALFINFVNRKTSYLINYTGAGIFCLLIPIVPAEYWWLRLIFAMTVKLGMSTAAAVHAVQMSEIYPTVIRTVAIGTGITASRIGAIISPFIKDLGNVTHEFVPYLLDAALCALCSVTALLLPETFNKALPDTFGDTEAANRSRQSKVFEVTETNPTELQVLKNCE